MRRTSQAELRQHHPAAEVTAAGGRRFATWLRSCFPTRRVGEKCSGLPGTGPWTLSAPVCPDNYPQRCETSRRRRVGDQGEPPHRRTPGAPFNRLRLGSAPSLGTCRAPETHLSAAAAAAAFLAWLNDGSPLTVAALGVGEHGGGRVWDFIRRLVGIIRVVLSPLKCIYCVQSS